MMMQQFLLIESGKFALFFLATILIIQFFHARYERIANQFSLVESTEPLHHGKNYADLFRNKIIKPCPLYPDNLVGVFDVNIYEQPRLKELEAKFTELSNGGFYQPKNCIPREKLAIIIPYRDRETNLLLLLKYLHPLLQKQARYYRVILVEQFGTDIFNKGRIMNIAVKEALKLDDFDCFIFHDVDMIPENDMNIYECYKEPRHLSPAVDELRYNLMYYNLVGGVLALNKHHLNRTNGFSNLYWGWGAEDDDMSMRILDNGFKITRPTNKIGRYKMILHHKRIRALNRFELLDYWKRYHIDGISSLVNLNYTIRSVKHDRLFTNVTVDVGPAVKEAIDKELVVNSKFKFF